MIAELDHIFVLTDAGAAAAALAGVGLTEGSPNAHPGQGTACRRFFFGNAYLELLWVSDPAEARAAAARATRLWERWSGRGGEACPFGVAFRPREGGGVEPPFARYWEYRPAYLPAPLCIQMAENSDVLTEPMLFHLPFAKRPDAQPVGKRQPLEHGLGLRDVTRVEVVLAHGGAWSESLEEVARGSLIGMKRGVRYGLEIGFDGETRGKCAEFGEVLPMRLCW